MSREAERINQIKSNLLALEMEISVIEGDLTLARMHLFSLKRLKKDLKFNLKILKERKVVVAAIQYREIIQELKSVESKIKHYENSIEILTKRKKQKKQSKILLRQNYDSLKYILDNKKVILRFDLSKRRATDAE